MAAQVTMDARDSGVAWVGERPRAVFRGAAGSAMAVGTPLAHKTASKAAVRDPERMPRRRDRKKTDIVTPVLE
jgi:hypothetical protein